MTVFIGVTWSLKTSKLIASKPIQFLLTFTVLEFFTVKNACKTCAIFARQDSERCFKMLFHRRYEPLKMKCSKLQWPIQSMELQRYDSYHQFHERWLNDVRYRRYFKFTVPNMFSSIAFFPTFTKLVCFMSLIFSPIQNDCCIF